MLYSILGGYYGEHETQGQMAVIARNNHTLLKGIFDILETSPDAQIAFAGGMSKFKFPILQDVYYLQQNQRDKIKSVQIKRFKNMPDLLNNATISEDTSLGIMISVRMILLHCYNLDII